MDAYNVSRRQRTIDNRDARDALRIAGDNTENPTATNDGPSTDPIGVPPSAPEPTEPTVPAEGDPQAYLCDTCSGPVQIGDKACPVCETALNWEGLI